MNKSWWWSVLFIVVGVLLGVGVLLLVTRPPRGKPIELYPAPTPAPITVYISGAVHSPGIENLPSGSRVNDAIQAAGGFTEEADTLTLNLAKLLVDGEHIDVPAINPPSPSGYGNNRVNPALEIVNINSATLEQLDTLPEIGPKIAQDIIDYRTSNGSFSQIEDILDVPGIGQATFDKIKDLITVE